MSNTVPLIRDGSVPDDAEVSIVVTGEVSGANPWTAATAFHGHPQELVFTGYVAVNGVRQSEEDLTFTGYVRGVVWGRFDDLEVPLFKHGLTLWVHLHLPGFTSEMVEMQFDLATRTGEIVLDEFNIPPEWFNS